MKFANRVCAIFTAISVRWSILEAVFIRQFRELYNTFPIIRNSRISGIAIIKNVLFCLEFEKLLLRSISICENISLQQAFIDYLSIYYRYAPRIFSRHRTSSARMRARLRIGRFLSKNSRKREDIARLDVKFRECWALIARENAIKRERKPRNYSSVNFGTVTERLYRWCEQTIQMTRSFSRWKTIEIVPRHCFDLSPPGENSTLQRIYQDEKNLRFDKWKIWHANKTHGA